MPGKGRFTEKQDRQIQHIIESEMKRGLSREEAEHRAYGKVQNDRKESKMFKRNPKRKALA